MEASSPTGRAESKWHRWRETWLSDHFVELCCRSRENAVWSVRFEDGVHGQIRVSRNALKADHSQFRQIVARLDDQHWVDVIRERGAIRIHENAWIEKVTPLETCQDPDDHPGSARGKKGA